MRGCRRLSYALLLVSAAFVACHADHESPESQIRALIGKAETAAEEKDIAALKELISESYAGPEGEDKHGLTRIIAYYLLRNQSIHLFTRIRRIELPQPKRAEATLFVAMAGRRIEAIEELSGLRADIYRVDVAFAEEGKALWRVTRAEWRPADVTDLADESETR